MGNRVSSQERTRRERAKRDLFDERIERVQTNQRERKQNQLVPYNPVAEIIGHTKIAQLERRGNALTKADLVALLLKLEKRDERDVMYYQSLSCNDLRAAIRLMVYDEPNAHHEIIEEVIEAPPPPYATGSYVAANTSYPIAPEGEPGN